MKTKNHSFLKKEDVSQGFYNQQNWLSNINGTHCYQHVRMQKLLFPWALNENCTENWASHEDDRTLSKERQSYTMCCLIKGHFASHSLPKEIEPESD